MVSCLPDLVRRAAILPSIGLIVHAGATVRGLIEENLEAGHDRITECRQVVAAFQGPNGTPASVRHRPGLDHRGELAVTVGRHREPCQWVVLVGIETGRYQEQLRLEGIERWPDSLLPRVEERPIGGACRKRHVEDVAMRPTLAGASRAGIAGV